MKKIIFIVALFTTGLITAKEGKVDEKINEKKSVKTETLPPAKQQSGCFSFTLSCGIPGTACGDSTIELIGLILKADDDICGK
ncbi:hypothetical protein [Riemerella anatipestifer]|uniref:hypothetical protein n=1 Tax=Riemerella anatipestifer TaxID=34085 RepID=UPI0007EC2DB7|nr:hypothetical protein [Riemerella anatipestifer]AZZ59032.1 hypothetical protein AWB57_08330 [Riemerella anatipestifer]MCW0511862.1 hypothetical protein [Riemerella anatipestifer]MCW0519048.1 hypothetical protein [Riemerella anatipestifer]MDD1538788.1 hypothetical protein [Riemerella anatipestifer]MDD1553981.1 hypothetical protein [Riemerella anatipestifer]